MGEDRRGGGNSNVFKEGKREWNSEIEMIAEGLWHLAQEHTTTQTAWEGKSNTKWKHKQFSW